MALKLNQKESVAMKVMLRDRQTGWYYQGPAKWTANRAEALQLDQVHDAVTVAEEAHLEDVEAVVCFEAPPQDIVLRLRNENSQA